MSKTLPRTMPASVLTAALLLLFPFVVVAQEEQLPAQQNANPNQDEPEVLTRGPVHEAFAEQINNNPTAGVLVPKAPPEPIGEVPPEYKPEGENVLWIPGYWSWDDEREDYIWISGVWRMPPLDRRWVPGYWHRQDTGYLWISGFWISTSQGAVQYQQKPPLSMEGGPTSAAPDQNHFWVPGCWQYGTTYRWRPGYWRPFRADWIWIPAHYVWTPRGSVFVNGYWDYRMPRRGQLFAPIYIPHHHHRHARYRYSPSCVINLGTIGMHLFVRPSYHHYYFGDYYGSAYSSRNFYSSFHYHQSGFGCDPFLTYYQWHFGRRGIDYTHRLRQSHRYLDHHQHHRPPRTLRSQTNIVINQNNRTNVNINQTNINALGRPLRDLAHDTHSTHKLVRLATEQRQSHQHKLEQLRDFRSARHAHERTDHPKTGETIAQQTRNPKPAGSRPHPNHRHQDLALPSLKPEKGKITRPAVGSDRTTANVGPMPRNPTVPTFKQRTEAFRQQIADKKAAANKAPANKPAPSRPVAVSTPSKSTPPTSTRPTRAPGKITRPAVGSDRTTANVGPMPRNPTVPTFKQRTEAFRQQIADKKAAANKAPGNKPAPSRPVAVSTPSKSTPPTSTRPTRAPGKITRPAVGSDRTTANVGPMRTRPSKPASATRPPTTARVTRTAPVTKPRTAPAAVPTRTQQRPAVSGTPTKRPQRNPIRTPARVAPNFPTRPSLPITKQSTPTPRRATSKTRPVPSSSLKTSPSRSLPKSSRGTSTRTAPLRKSSTPAPSPRPTTTRSSSKRIVGPLPSNPARTTSPKSSLPRTRTTTPRNTVRPSSNRSMPRSPSLPKSSFKGQRSSRTGSSGPTRKSVPRSSPSPRKK